MQAVITKTKPRLHTIDFLRGVCIIFVAWYHFMYYAHSFTPMSFPFMFSNAMNSFRDMMVAILIMISGFSCVLSKSNYKRGAKTLALGLLISLVTYIFARDMLVMFGILHFMGSMMLISELIKPILIKISPKYGFVFILLFFLTYRIQRGYLLIPFGQIELPRAIYETPIGFIFGLPYTGFSSSDYYAIIPWCFLYFFGFIFANHFKVTKFPVIMYIIRSRWIEFLGRHTLVIYFLHIGVFLAFFQLLNMFYF